MMREAVLVFVLCVLSLSVAQDCPPPTIAQIEAALNTLLLNSDGSQSYSPNVTGSVQYVCQAQGNMNDTYDEVALVATFTPNPGEHEQTRIFDMVCDSGTWNGTTGSLSPLPDCYRCQNGFGGNTRCRACTLTCPDGYTANSNCTGCDFNSTYDAYSPCMNGGQCIQYSPPDNYTCNHTGTGYQGDNCTVVVFSSTPSPTSSPTPSSTVSSSPPSPSPSLIPVCAIDLCNNCQNSSCCKTCSSGSYLNPDGCTCGSCRVSNCSRCQLLNLSCCTECVSGYELVNDCQCGAINCQSPSASSIAAITVLSLIAAVCITVIVALAVVVVINNKKQKLQLQQPSHDYGHVISPTVSDPVTQANQAYQVGRQLL